MPRQIRFQNKNNAVGQVSGVLRIIGKYLFLKVNSYAHGRELIEKYRNAGVGVEEKKDWMRINLFHTNKQIILGDIRIDSEEETDEEIEKKLFEFYMLQYARANMKVWEEEMK